MLLMEVETNRLEMSCKQQEPERKLQRLVDMRLKVLGLKLVREE